jgi:hypothetical protein
LKGLGFEAHLFDGTAPLAAAALGKATHVLCTIAPGTTGDPALKTSARVLRDARWLGYLSTTGVYGDHGGGWVDEETPARPAQQRSIERLATERAWQATGWRRARPSTSSACPASMDRAAVRSTR